MTAMADITEFRGVLSPLGRTHLPPPSPTSPDGLILAALDPLRGDLGAALARNDQQAALRIAYGALSRLAEALATARGDKLRCGQARIHALLVQLKPLPLESLFDGTLREGGTEVEVSYRNWTMDRMEAAAWAGTLTQRFQALWPGAWIVVSR